MLHVLDNYSDRLITILHVLFKSDGKISFDTLSDTLDISEKTLYDDLTFINENWDDIIEISLSDTDEICAPKMSMSTFLTLQSMILLDAVPIKIIKAIFFYPNEKLSFYSEHLHLSASTFYKYVHLWNEDLKRYNIQIQNTQSSYQIIGDNEISLRRFFTILFLEVSGYSSKVFLTHEKNDFLKNRIKNLYEHNKEEISQLQISFYADLYYVSLQREIQGYKVELPDNFIGDYLPLCDFGRSILSTHYSSLTEEDVYRIEASILVLRTSLNSYTDEHLEKTIPNFLNDLYNTFHIKKEDKVYHKLLTYLKDLYINNLFVNIPFHLISNKYVYFTTEALKNNAWAISEINYLVASLSLQANTNFNYHIDYLIYIFITQLPEIMKNRITQHVLIISSDSQDHAKFLCRMIQTELNMEPVSFEHVDCIHEKDLHKVDYNSYELIITNSIVVNQTIDSLLISGFPSSKDILAIKDILLT